jgi:glutamine synthetase
VHEWEDAANGREKDHGGLGSPQPADSQAKEHSVSEKTSDDIFKLAKDENIEYVDVRFCDLPGTMQHFTIPIYVFDENVFEEGLAFDGSSIRGFQSIHESDMLLLPDPETATIDPFRAAKTLNLNFFVHDPYTLELYSRDPRNVARKAENYLISSGIADAAYFGPEAEFYIFDSVSFDSHTNESFYKVDATSGWWNTGEPTENDGSPNLGYKVRPKGGYFPVAPTDHYVDLRDAMLTHLTDAGFVLEKGHHEVGGGGQAEINYKFNTLLHAADDHQMYKYIVKQTAWQAGKTVTFMPKPLFGDNGSGMHAHQSLWKDGGPLFYDQTGYAGLSDTARHYIGGLLYHAPSLLAFTWFPASRRRSTWSTASATARPACASRSPAATRRPSGWSSAALTPRATRTFRSRP